MVNSLLGFFNHMGKNNNHNSMTRQGLIFEPNTVAYYNTVEFDYKATINSLGLRNKEFKIDKDKGTFRILCFGDSWTFGWGVDIEKSWPMQMEKFLHSNGYLKTEVINCGQGDQYTTTYKKYLFKAVTLLKPDFVLIGVLQLDDLAQLYENNFSIENDLLPVKQNQISISKVKLLFTQFLKASFNNYIELLKNPSKEIPVRSSWELSSNNMIKSFNGLQKLRFSALSDTVQTLFRTGNLNPGLLYYHIHFPDRRIIFNNPFHPATKFAIKEMDKDLKEMKIISENNMAEIIFINLPLNYFTGHKVDGTPSDILDKYFADNNKIDSIYHSIATRNKIQYFELTTIFKKLGNKKKYFFQFDGHPSEEGYKEMGINIGQYIINNNFINKLPD
jgi:lysophospholipase L1-like esterase